MNKRDPKGRFSDRVTDYKRYRPTYPQEIIAFILENCHLDKSWSIADIGSGTGISTRLLLEFKCHIYAVEPNKHMRKAAEDDLSSNSLFHCVDGCAETTTLDDSSMDMVTAFQSFHWFDREKTRAEFFRILKEPKWVLFVWNDRIISGNSFLEGYEEILQSLPEYKSSTHKSIFSKDICCFMGNDEVKITHLPKAQEFDFEGLKGRFSSSSYTPKPETDEYKEVMSKIEKLFKDFNENGLVTLQYKTDVYLGRLS